MLRLFSPNNRIVQGTNSRISPLTTNKLIVGPSNLTGWFTLESYSGEKGGKSLNLIFNGYPECNAN